MGFHPLFVERGPIPSVGLRCHIPSVWLRLHFAASLFLTLGFACIRFLSIQRHISYVGLRSSSLLWAFIHIWSMARGPIPSVGLRCHIRNVWLRLHFAESLFLTLGFACIRGCLSIQRHISYVGLRASYGLSRVPCVGARTAYLRLGWKAPKTGIEPVSPPAGQGNHNHKAKSAFQQSRSFNNI